MRLLFEIKWIASLAYYRPIPAVLSIFGKTFEKAMFKRLYGYLEYYNIIFPLQFGYVSKITVLTVNRNILITQT